MIKYNAKRIKTLLISTALISAPSLSSAGPLFDDLFLGEMNYSSSNESISNDMEVYRDFKLLSKQGAEEASADMFAIKKVGKTTSVQIEGLSTETGSGDTAYIASLEFSFNHNALNEDADFEKIFSEELPDAETCVASDFEILTSMKGFSVDPDGPDRFDIQSIDAKYDILDPEGDCIVDMVIDVIGVDGTIADPMPIDITAAQIFSEVYSSMRIDKLPSDTSKNYTASISVSDASLGMSGAEQVSLGNFILSSETDVKTLDAVEQSGYQDFVNALALSDFDDYERIEKTAVPKLWNALREISASGLMMIEDVVITGNMAQMMSGSDAFAPGRSFNVSTEIIKEKEVFKIGKNLEISDFASLSFGLSGQMDEMSPDFMSLSEEMMAMSFPISFTGMDVSYVDEGISSQFSRFFGMDPYVMTYVSLTDMIGESKSALVRDWLMSAKTGGARFSASPVYPLAPMEVITGAMGDWNKFGQRINADVN